MLKELTIPSVCLQLGTYLCLFLWLNYKGKSRELWYQISEDNRQNKEKIINKCTYEKGNGKRNINMELIKYGANNNSYMIKYIYHPVMEIWHQKKRKKIVQIVTTITWKSTKLNYKRLSNHIVKSCVQNAASNNNNNKKKKKQWIQWDPTNNRAVSAQIYKENISHIPSDK